MATTIKLKNSVTTTNAPSSLVQGEVAINITDKKVWVGNAATTPIQLLGAGASGTFGALTCTSLTNSGLTSGRVTYASTGGLLADSANFTFNGTTVTMANDASISGLTVGKGTGAVVSNTAVGASALLANTTGSTNSAFGQYALFANTTGYDNTGLGRSAMETNTTGLADTAIGRNALYANTSGSYNTAIGKDSLYSNTTASNNTAVGYQAGYSNTTGINSVFMGYQAGYGSTASYSYGFGYQALYSANTGVENCAFGYRSLYANTSGNNNSAYGDSTLVANTTGANNTAIGLGALQANTTASNNTAVGYQAGYSNTTNGANAFFGALAGYSNTGVTNTYLGYGAGYSMTTGGKNVIIGGYNGNQGGLDIRTLSNHIVLSDGDGNPRAYWNNRGVLTSTNDNADNIAYFKNTSASSPYGLDITFSAATPNNTTQTFLACGDSTNYKLFIYSSGTVSNRTGTYNTISDAKLKENIVDATPKLDKLMQTRVVNYNLIGDELKQIGFVAQELETVFPSLIDNVPDLDENKQPTGEVTKSVKLTVMIPILVKAIQELKAEVDSLKAQLNKE